MGVRQGATLSAPVPIAELHDTSAFVSGHDTLDEWLRRRALANHQSGASRTYVACEGDVVIAYYALASGGFGPSHATGRFRRNMPDPIPVAIFARLAVDRRWQGHGLGRALFRDGARRILGAADAIGIRGLIVHAISDEAVGFYEALGLTASPVEPRTLMITLDDLRAAL